MSSRQTRRQTRASVPAVEAPLTPAVTAPPKRHLPELDVLLDTPAPKKARAEDPKTPSLPTPTTVQRRSSRLSGRPNVDYSVSSVVDEEEPEVPKTTAKSRPQAIGPPTGRRASARLSGRTRVEVDDQEFTTDDLEEDCLDVSDDEGQATKHNVKVPFVDKDGLTRIGPQPKQPAVYVGWAPRAEAVRSIHAKLWDICRDEKKSMPTSARFHEAEMEATEHKLVQSLVAYGPDNNKVTLHCAYTGNQLSWAPGPQSVSVEAIYPYVVSDQQLRYHTAQNVTTISSSLNWAKGKSASILLPLLATWIKAYDAPGLSFKQRKGRLAWAFNAVSNEGLIAGIYGLRISHEAQLDNWRTWTLDKQRQFIELFRTGRRTSDVANEIDSYDTEDFYYVRRKSESLIARRDCYGDA
ncbi:hypothetical protein CFAM422_013336 [Trichoderma lentiforme]|uniref:Uncharacterized protein n=1 Tax=Trichoderma lentiforme TaxID=1567552 RepID=A0A9P4X2R0_9HYPO|nr:hypothetical protein CFAM422_013336 [Trichoderma lentiforme]